MGKVIIHILIGSVATFLGACASNIGDIDAIVQMGSNVQVLEPKKALPGPSQFPQVTLLWEAATGQRQNFGSPYKQEARDKKFSAHSKRLNYPKNPGYLSSSAQRFVNSAKRISQSIFDGKSTDPSIALSLLEQVKKDTALGALREQWTPILTQTIELARLQQPIEGALRGLRAAFRRARFDEEVGIYRNLDVTKCRLVTDRIQNHLGDKEHYVRIAPIGTQPIKHFRTLCEQTLLVELTERRFPTPNGDNRVRGWIRNTYEADYPGARVRKIHIKLPWKSSESARTVQATLGIVRNKSYPATPCTMETILIRHPQKHRDSRAPLQIKLLERVPINCDQIR